MVEIIHLWDYSGLIHRGCRESGEGLGDTREWVGEGSQPLHRRSQEPGPGHAVIVNSCSPLGLQLC